MTFKDTTGYVLANAGYLVGQLLIVIAISRILGIAAVGTWALALALVMPGYQYLHGALRIVHSTDIGSTRSHLEYERARLYGTLLLATVVVAVYCLTYAELLDATLVAAVFGARAIDGFCETSYAERQRAGELAAIQRSMLLRVALLPATVIVALFLAQDLAIAVWCGTLAAAVVFWFHDRSRDVFRAQSPDGTPTSVVNTLQPLWQNYAPGFAIMAASTVVYLPIYFIAGARDTAALGQFNLFYYLLTSATSVFVPAAAVLATELARLGASVQKPVVGRRIALGVGAVVCIGAVASLVGYQLGPWIIDVLYGVEVADMRSRMALTAAVGTLAILSMGANHALIGVGARHAQLGTVLLGAAVGASMGASLGYEDPVRDGLLIVAATCCGHVAGTAGVLWHRLAPRGGQS